MAGLREELLTDPLTRGYSGMSDQAAADDLNLIYLVSPRTRNRESMTGDEVFQSIESQTIWDGLSADQRSEFLHLCGRDSIDPFGTANVDAVKSIFGDGSATVTALAVARVEDISRAEELPDVRSPVTRNHVVAARA